MLIHRIQDLSAAEVIYGVYRAGALIHIGEGQSIARPAQYVQDLKKDGQNDISARFVEIETSSKADLAMPSSVSSSVLFRGNLERLLQAAFFWQYRRLPELDLLRGGKGAESVFTGGFVRDVGALASVFSLLEQLLTPASCAHPWPAIPDGSLESVAASPTDGLGRPRTRSLHLAFWVNVRDARAFFGHVPLAGKQAHYSAAVTSVVWRSTCP